MLRSSIRVGDRQPVFYRIFGHCVVVGVIDFLIHNGLNLRILGRIDLKASGIEEISRLTFRIA